MQASVLLRRISVMTLVVFKLRLEDSKIAKTNDTNVISY